MDETMTEGAITLEEAKELANCTMPCGKYEGMKFAQIRVSHLRYLSHLRRTTKGRPVRVRKSLREKISRYLYALRMFEWQEVRICQECGTVNITGQVREMNEPCNECGCDTFIPYRQFREN